MKYKFRDKLLGFIITAFSFSPMMATATSMNDLVSKSLSGDYQAQRNLAFSYKMAGVVLLMKILLPQVQFCHALGEK